MVSDQLYEAEKQLIDALVKVNIALNLTRDAAYKDAIENFGRIYHLVSPFPESIKDKNEIIDRYMKERGPHDSCFS
jgi:hypothetical protein